MPSAASWVNCNIRRSVAFCSLHTRNTTNSHQVSRLGDFMLQLWNHEDGLWRCCLYTISNSWWLIWNLNLFTNIWFFKKCSYMFSLTHWGRVTQICVSKLAIIGSDNGLSPGRRQAIIWINAGILLIGSLGTNFSEILMEIYKFSFKKMHLKMSSGKWRLSCLGLNVLMSTIPLSHPFVLQ